jgi:hypothetical protein
MAAITSDRNSCGCGRPVFLRPGARSDGAVTGSPRRTSSSTWLRPKMRDGGDFHPHLPLPRCRSPFWSGPNGTYYPSRRMPSLLRSPSSQLRKDAHAYQGKHQHPNYGIRHGHSYCPHRQDSRTGRSMFETRIMVVSSTRLRFDLDQALTSDYSRATRPPKGDRCGWCKQQRRISVR